MSLGAIDFGLIVDGAVIVVENASRRLAAARRERGRALTDGERVETIESATLEVRKATVFGEAIVAIVYLPILALTGVEGKLFTPMALTVLLALAGAFILSLTLVPVLTSYLVRPGPDEAETWLLRASQRLYKPALAAALRWRGAAITATLVAFAGAAALFPRLGAVFVPQLDEGDLLVEGRRLPGTALSTVVDTSLRVQRALLPIPEVTGVVTRIGSPVLAIDSMSIEQSDVYIQLKPPEEWRAGIIKDDLADEITERLEEAVPEVVGSISQPIQMRTNELVAGIRSDVGVVFYGPDLDALRELGDAAVARLGGVPGVVDLRAEQIDGLRYLKIEPDRARLARFGLSVADLAQATETLAVGHPVGEVLEGDRRFEVVLKLDHRYDGDLGAIRALPLRASSGQLVPLGDVAEVRFETGPALVNRDKQSRRIIVELNVRGRDLVSTVADAQAALADLELPLGYRVEYGGTFEHYITAKDRLLIVVPVALALILFLLWTALGRVRAALIIFLNVPFAVIGGVVILWLRGLPFSISAGIGFIALFGVAVLNGLVMVTFCQRIQRDEGASPADAIRRAAEIRLRPVLTTALTTALGFIPMALSTAPGSEVQRPLASVVLGGLVSASLLTLLVLPAVYAAFGPDERRPPAT
jgi:cobalt-zinc-cadmium resistance protein CzcA